MVKPDGDLLFELDHCSSHFGLQLSLNLAAQNICLATRMLLKCAQLLGQLLTIGLKAMHLFGQLRLELGIQRLLLLQRLLQPLQLDL